MKFDPKIVDVPTLLGGVRSLKIILEPAPVMKMVDAPLVSNEVVVTPFEGTHWVIACPRDSTLETIAGKPVYLCSKMLLKKAVSIKEAASFPVAFHDNRSQTAGIQSQHRRC